ncbi:MAG: large-conductance mechanosensitive channel protein MscL [Clostridia bacterium]|nr:large-conductance mechanosensitive channel protein MscL [Clostridia bacterium]
MKSFMKEFKEFIAKGNVMSMAVGIIIGGAFTAIVNSLVADIITPILGMILGGTDFAGLSVTVGSAVLTYGNFIQAIITFFMTALTIFIIMRQFNKMKKKEEEEAPPAPDPEPSEEVKLLTEIRDSLRK